MRTNLLARSRRRLPTSLLSWPGLISNGSCSGSNALRVGCPFTPWRAAASRGSQSGLLNWILDAVLWGRPFRPRVGGQGGEL
eukprot:6199266-Pleurochrysis_carterae.AAC.6